MGLIKTLAIILIVYYIFKFIGKYILPLFIKRVVNNVEKKYKEQQGFTETKSEGEVGETVIDKKPNRNEGNKNVGDYVDYEEIND